MLATLFILCLLYRRISGKSEVLSSEHIILKEKFKKGYRWNLFFSGLGYFPIPERDDFSKNSDILRLRKMFF